MAQIWTPWELDSAMQNSSRQHIQAPAKTTLIQKPAEMDFLGQDELERCRLEASEAKATIEASSTKRTHSSAKPPAVSEAKLEEEVMIRERAERERDALREQVRDMPPTSSMIHPKNTPGSCPYA